MVNMYAIGSLLPLSNSSIGRKFSFKFIFCERSKLKTEAESVEDMVAANNIQVSNDKEKSIDVKEERK